MNTDPKRVLLIEDSAAEADLIQHLLAQSTRPRFDVQHVTRVEDGIRSLTNGAFDVLLLDMQLPDSSGLDGFQSLETAAPRTPIIFLTNMNDEGLADEAVRRGAQDYLIKRDIDTGQLVRAIRYAIERQRSEEALRESEERYALAVAGANDGVWDWDLARGTTYFSLRWKGLLGYAESEIGDRIDEWFKRVHPEDMDFLMAELAAHQDGNTTHFEHEHRIQCKQGVYLWVLCRGLAVRDPAGKAYRMAGSMTDITLRKNVEAQLMHDALHDALTGLPNRSLYLDRLGHALRQFKRDESRAFAVLYFDLNRFKYINDSLGHTAGDEMLIAVARRLEKFLRPGDTLARLGGDEFAILMNGFDETSDVTQVAERIHELLSQEFVLQGHEVFTSASIGIAVSAKKYLHPEELLRDADLAMYRAKHSGTVCCEIFDNDMHEGAVAKLKLETDLRRALERSEFVVHYQPIVSVGSGRIMSFEALLRWQHPQHGLIYPDSFIFAAEETGLIVPLCWWVLEEVIDQTVKWQRLFPVEPPISVSVNISGKLFRGMNMADRLLDMLASKGLASEGLRLEITESAIMDHREAAIVELTKLRAEGVQLHIDDFGTGYSSLTYLQRFAYDTLKIDRSFVGMMNTSGDSEAIVKAIVALGKMLDMNVVAEGVETTNQLNWLREMGCPEAQGYLFSKPLDNRMAQSLLDKEVSTLN